MINARMNYMLLPMYHIFQNKKISSGFYGKTCAIHKILYMNHQHGMRRSNMGIIQDSISSHLQKQALAIKNEKCLTL